MASNELHVVNVDRAKVIVMQGFQGGRQAMKADHVVCIGLEFLGRFRAIQQLLQVSRGGLEEKIVATLAGVTSQQLHDVGMFYVIKGG